MSAKDLKKRLEERWAKQGSSPFPNINRKEEEDEDDQEEDEFELREVWCSGRKKDAHKVSVEVEEIERIKREAKRALADQQPEIAEQLYSNGLIVLNEKLKEQKQEEGQVENDFDKDVQTLASVLYNNRAYARLEQQRWLEASSDAYAAAELQPSWAKPYYRLAQAKTELGDFRGAIGACRLGEKILHESGDRSGEFTPLMDRISTAAVISGSLAAFDGRLLEVRSAGEEAWLGRPAPENPLIDEEPEEISMHFSLDPSNAATNAALVAKAKAKANESKRLSFRSIKEAVDAARDGDRILILRGIHNTQGETIFVNKRVLIRSEGTIEETTIDHRGNSPIFRITRNAVLQNIDIDMTGFREALYIYGGPLVMPVVEHCRLKCSGDDAINVSGDANPVLRNVHVASCKKIGLKLFERARGEYIGLKISNCSQQAVKLMENSRGNFHKCYLKENVEEGIVIMDNAHASMNECEIMQNKGPGIDISGNGRLIAMNCEIGKNFGGLWMWASTKASICGSNIDGGKSHAILADGESLPDIQSCKIEGMIQATDEAWEGILTDSNKLIESRKPVELPPEDGAFKFDPVWYQRKQ